MMRTRLRHGEECDGLFRRHWITLGGPFGLAFFFMGCLIASVFIERPYLKEVFGTLFGISALWAGWRWLVWRADLWAVTSHRVVDESGVLNVRTVDSPLDKIHNVTLEQSLAGRMLDFGTIDIQTGAEHGENRIERVERPHELKEAILERQERFRRHSTAVQMEPLLRAAAGAAAAAGGGLATGASGAGGAAAPHEGTTKDCPHCAETIKVKATVCRYCGRPV